MADCKIQRVYTGIAGSHIRSFNSTGMVAVQGQGGDAGRRRARDRDRERDAASRPTSRCCTSSPQEFVIDGQDGIREPIGMSGGAARGEGAHRHRRGERGAEHRQVRAPLRARGRATWILQPLASALAVLTEDEKDLGVALVDIGGGTTDVAIFTRRRDPPHRGDPDRRRPDHQRHRDGAAHADPDAEEIKVALRLRAARSSPTRTR